MEYKGFTYNVVQILGTFRWRWSVQFDQEKPLSGTASNRPTAITRAKRAIDNAIEKKS
jgi:hypothetical protein